MISSSQINLFWIASTDSGGSGLQGYYVYRNGSLAATVSASAISYFDIGLSPSTVYSYYVVAFDGAGNQTQSNTISLTTLAPPDTAAPVFIQTSPSASLPSGTTSATLAGTTNEWATCKYATVAGRNFDTQMTAFATTGGATGTTHSQSFTGLTDGTLYTYYLKCRDAAGNTTGDITIMFAVASPAPDTAAPVFIQTSPSASLPSGTTSATLAGTT
ncbi:fibronectin type III domain-containing protein, partial [Candidatus Azambacteria bacterium]|nr:fibronectin type III domain-containing protein [Candidatus Azambacteria bacterium]